MSWSVTLAGKTFTDADFSGQGYVSALPAALKAVVDHGAALYTATSATSLSVVTGPKTLIIQAGKPWGIGAPIRISRTAAPDTTYMDGIVTAHNSATGAMSVSVVAVAGAGTYTDWTINIGGARTMGSESPLPLAEGGLGAAGGMNGGTAALPGLPFALDADTGFYRPAADVLAVATGGVERWRTHANGYFLAGSSFGNSATRHAFFQQGAQCLFVHAAMAASGAAETLPLEIVGGNTGGVHNAGTRVSLQYGSGRNGGYTSGSGLAKITAVLRGNSGDSLTGALVLSPFVAGVEKEVVWVEGSPARVGINTNSPSYVVDVTGSDSTVGVRAYAGSPAASGSLIAGSDIPGSANAFLRHAGSSAQLGHFGVTSVNWAELAASGSGGLAVGTLSAGAPLILGTANAERMYFDPAGPTAALGVRPAAWKTSSGYTNFQIGASALVGRVGATTTTWFSNVYVDASSQFVYQTSAAASYIGQDGGSVYIARAPAGVGGAAATMTLTTQFDNAGNVVIGAGALATGATDGFLYLPTVAGAPTGIATPYSGRAPVVIDASNNRLYVRTGAGWKYATLN